MKSMLRAVTKKYLLLLISLALTASMGFALTAGLSSGYYSLEKSLDKYLSDYGYPDGYITTDVTSVKDAEAIRKIPGVEAVDTSLCADTMLQKENGDYLAVRVFSYTDQDLQKFYSWEHADDDDENRVLLEYHFAKSHNIKAGDTVSFKFRNEYRPFFVEGIVSRPETLHAKFSEKAWGINYDFGFAYMQRELLAKEYEKDFDKEKSKIDEKAEDLTEERDKADQLLKNEEQKLADAKKLLADKKSSYAVKKAKVEQAETKLKKTKASLTKTSEKLGRSEEALKKAIKKAKKAKKDLKSKRKSLLEAKKALSEINAQLAKYEKLEKLLDRIENSCMIKYLRSLPPDTLLIDALEPKWKTIREDIAKLEEYLGIAIPIDEITVGDFLSMYDKAVAKIREPINELKDKREEILKKLAEYGIKEDGIDKAVADLDKAIEKTDKGLVKLKKNLKKAKKTDKKVRKGIKKTNKLLAEAAAAEKKLLKAKKQLKAAGKKIEQGEATLRRKTAETLREFADIEEQLDRAYKKLGDSEGYDQLCNRFMIYMDDGADQEEVLASACEVFGEDTQVISSYTYDESPVKSRIDRNLYPIRALTVYCPIIFYIITLGIIFMFMSMIIRQSRRQIGILRALGITKGQIRAMFCTMSVLVALFGILVGCGLGAGILRYIGGFYQGFFPLPTFSYLADIDLCVAGAAATVAVCLIATLITTGAISSITPQEAMSRQMQTRAKLPAWAERLTSWMRPLSKFSLTSLLRNKGRFVFSSICISASIMLIFTSVSFIASKNYTIEQVFPERIHYDCQVFLDEAPDDKLMEKIRSLSYVEEAQPLLYYEVDISTGDKTENAVVNAIEPDTEMVSIPSEEALGSRSSSEKLKVQSGGIVIEKYLASELSIKPGDTVTVNGEPFRVSAISEQCANRIQYISINDAGLLGDPDLGCVLCVLPEENQQDLLSWLMDEDVEGYLYTMFMQSFFRYNLELYETYDTAAWILIWFAIALGFIIILNTAMTTLMDTKRELCVLRSLGFQHGEISRSRFLQTIFQFLISCPLGLFAGVIFAKQMLLKISSSAEEYIFASGIREYAAAIGIVAVYLVISHLLAMHSTTKWDITEIVKDKE